MIKRKALSERIWNPRQKELIVHIGEDPAGNENSNFDIQFVWCSPTAMVVDKPSGLSTTAPPGVVSLQSSLKELLGSGQSTLARQTNFNGYLTPVHRLDRCTSGLLLVALTKKSARLLSEQFVARKIRKGYVAWLCGNAEPMVRASDGLWRDWIRKIPDEACGEVCDERSDGAVSCETRVEFREYDRDNNRSLVKLSPVTGRMHQLRLQSAHRGLPIVGDSLYMSDSSGKRTAPLQIALSAQSLKFHDPRSGQVVMVESKRSCQSILAFDS